MFALPLATFIMLVCTAEGDSSDDSAAWQSVSIARQDQAELRLRVKREASLADEEWLAFEFVNHKRNRVIQFRSLSYCIDATHCDPTTGEPLSFGGLASGGSRDLVKVGPVRTISDSPRVDRAAWHPSTYSAALLGLPPETGWLVKGELRVAIESNDRTKLRDMSKPCKFEFLWRYPSEDEFAKLAERLTQLLQNPVNRAPHAYILHTLLGIPRVAEHVSLDDLFSAMESRGNAFGGRNYIAEHLGTDYAKHPRVLQYFLKKLVEGDTSVVDDLWYAKNIWSDEYVDPIVVIFEETRRYSILLLLETHGCPQAADPELAKRLSRVLLPRGELPALHEDEIALLRREKQIARYANLAYLLAQLGKTRDRTLVPQIARYLDNRHTVRDSKLFSAYGLWEQSPLRLCDAAMDAIHDILDGQS